MTNLIPNELGVLSIDDYVTITKKVWVKIHPRRTTFDYALHVLDHATKLGEAIRRDNVDIILREIAETANWLCGFVAKLQDVKIGWESRFNIPTKFSRIIWNKYPGICPHCFQKIYLSNDGKKSKQEIVSDIKGKCKYCLVDYPRIEIRTDEREYKRLKAASDKELREYAQDSYFEIPKNLKDIEKMFHSMYESNIALTTLESIGFHILEEAGEMGRAVIDLYTDKNTDPIKIKEKEYELCDEISEVFAWLCSLTMKVRDQAKNFDKYLNKLISYAFPRESSRQLAELVGLEEILWVTYRDKETKQFRCPYCGFTTCTCKLRFAWEPH